jgi:putative methanogenesis marker protein 17
MEVKVEGGEEFANKSYKKICLDTFRDVGVRSSLDITYMYCNPMEHVFIISVKIGRVSSPIKVKDITLHAGKDELKITEERHAPRLLAMLWDRYGERVQQRARLVVGLDLEDEEVEALKDLIIYDPREDLVLRILDGIDRILPEGARVRASIPSTPANIITIIASENPIGEEWKKKAEKMMGEVREYV